MVNTFDLAQPSDRETLLNLGSEGTKIRVDMKPDTDLKACSASSKRLLAAQTSTMMHNAKLVTP